MDMALLIAKSGLDAHHKNIEVISNNLANSNTPAFKRNRAEFQDLPYQVISEAGSPVTQDMNAPSNVVIGTGTKMSNNKKIFIDGAPIQTGSPLDVMISGRGLLKVETTSGNYAYTRDGRLQVNELGQLVTSTGYVIQPPITMPQGAQAISISKDGVISAATSDSVTSLQQVGQIELTDFINPDGLIPVGENLYQETTASGTGIIGNPLSNGLGYLVQGSYEASNVNVVEEMVNLIEAQRAFEVTSKAVSAVDNMLQQLSRET
jgi:flagellar basal-body rod protein FlgG